MKKTVTTYILIACASFLILALVQLYLVLNTYELKNERYYFSEKTAIRDRYSEAVKHDLMFPGSERLIHSIVAAQLPALQAVVRTDTAAFRKQKESLALSLLRELRAHETIEAILQQAKAERKIGETLEYALIFEKLEITVGDSLHVPVLTQAVYNDTLKKERPEYGGFRIGGTLQSPDPQNRVVELTIGGGGTDTLSHIKYSFYVEPLNRQLTIFKQLSLTLLLSLFSVLFVVLLFYVTFRNWLRQKKLSEMKSDFINNITHEFHTPLTAIQVANKSLQNERILEKKENIQSLTAVIQRQSDRLQMLIAQVLDIASSNRMQLKKKEYAVNELLEELLLDYRLQLNGRAVDLAFDKRTTNDRILLDQFHFGTMMINILDNAVKYNDKDTIGISVITMADDKYFRIVISDNGMGMPPETLKHIFDKFYRGKNGLAKPVKGLGLGLFYVQQQVEAHGWTIRVESEPERGSTFTLIMPFQTPQA